MIIRNEVKGAVLTLLEDGNVMHVYFTDLMDTLWNDYVREVIGDVYTRGLLKDLQFPDTQVFHMLEQLQVGRREYNNGDYLEASYQ